MKEFYEFDEERHKSKSSMRGYIVIALIFLLLGGVLMYAAAPYLPNIGRDIAAAPNPSSNPTEPPQDGTEPNSSVPALGYQGDLFITADNPVVDIAAQVGPAVVGITTTTEVVVPDFFFNQRTVEREGYGSGIIISEAGHIVTNYHVVQNARNLFVILQGGTKLEAVFIGGDPESDIAVIQVDHPDLTVAKLGNSDLVRQGELAIAIGNPLGHNLAGTVTAGIISAVDRTLQIDRRTLKLLQTDAAINQGNSGGPLVNSRGEVIGMNTVKLAGAVVEGLGFAIPSNVFIPIVQQIIETGNVERPAQPWVGIIQPAEIDADRGREFDLPVGILVRDVYPGSPAEEAGILPGDVLLAFDGVEPLTMAALRETIEKKQVGDVVSVKVWRNGNDFVLRIKLADMAEIQQQP